MRFVSLGKSRSFGILTASLALLLGGTAAQAESWFSENFEVHGFVKSNVYFRTPGFANEVQTSSWRNELNLESSVHLYDSDDWRVDFYTVLRPTYDLIYEVQGDKWGAHVDVAEFGTSPAFPDDPVAGAGLGVPAPRSFAQISGNGKGGEESCIAAGLSRNCVGARVSGEFTLINSDTASLFDGELTPAISIDNVVFFGRVTAPVSPRGSGQARIGGNASGNTYEDLRDNFVVFNGGLPATFGLDAFGRRHQINKSTTVRLDKMRRHI